MKVEFVENSGCVIIETEKNGLKTSKSVAITDFISSLDSAIESKNYKHVESPLFRECLGSKLIQHKTVGINQEIYILLKEKGQVIQQIYSRVYPNVGIPNLLFAVKVVNNRVMSLNVVAVKDIDITEKTQLYIYPFTNVSSLDGAVCLGANKFTPGVKVGNKLYNVPNQFLSMPNTLHSYRPTRNSKGMEFEEMLMYLNNKNFDDEILVKCESFPTYQEWFSQLN